MKVAVVLSGCGHLDGAEIRESVLSLLYLDKQGAQVQCFAPDQAFDVVNHVTGQQAGEKRNVLEEAGRIARGKIQSLREARAQDFDALVMPGGFGVAKNLSDFAFKGAQAAVLPELKKLIGDFHSQSKPIVAICIAPAVLAAALSSAQPVVTIGDDAGTAAAIKALGGKHQNCATADCVVDEKNRLVTTPAYMHDAPLSDIAQGIEKTIAELVRMARQKSKAA